MAVAAIPDAFHSVTPYLVVHGAAELIQFLKQLSKQSSIIGRLIRMTASCMRNCR